MIVQRGAQTSQNDKGRDLGFTDYNTIHRDIRDTKSVEENCRYIKDLQEFKHRRTAMVCLNLTALHSQSHDYNWAATPAERSQCDYH
jgi:hypothetical protein